MVEKDTMANENINTGTFGIKKLRGISNYQDWKFQIRTLLAHKNLWSAIEPGTNANGTPIAVDTEKKTE